jgi:hypothetical protein
MTPYRMNIISAVSISLDSTEQTILQMKKFFIIYLESNAMVQKTVGVRNISECKVIEDCKEHFATYFV